MTSNDAHNGPIKSGPCAIREAVARAEEITDMADGSDGASTGKSKQADILIALASEATVFRTPEGMLCADIEIHGHRETWPLQSATFRHWLDRLFFEETGSAPGTEGRNQALNILQAKARFEGEEHSVFVRVGSYQSSLYLDLGDQRWRAVEIGEGGWRIVDRPPVRFRRTAGLKPLPEPEHGGSIEDLKAFLNVRTETDFVLAVSWLLACLRPDGPFPVLVLTGEQGSAKSSFTERLRDLVDPNDAPLRALPREERDLFIAATNGHMLAYDNVSSLPPWMSDTLCRLATGGGFAVRQLYSDQDEVLFKAARPIVLNGIEDFVTRPDLADRSLLLGLEPIPEEKRQQASKLRSAFAAALPKILGALLDGVVEGLRRKSSICLDRLPRMADFAVWAAACETAYWPEGTFTAAYERNRASTVDTVIESDPVGAAIRMLMQTQEAWTGTATELLNVLTGLVDEGTRKDRSWPKTSSVLSGKVKRAATFLRKAGVSVDHIRKGAAGQRLITLERMTGKSLGAASVASAPSDPSNDNGFTDAPPDAGRVQSVSRKAAACGTADAADGTDALSPTQLGRRRITL